MSSKHFYDAYKINYIKMLNMLQIKKPLNLKIIKLLYKCLIGAFFLKKSKT